VPKDVIGAVRVLARLCPDDGIAAWLTRNGIRTGTGNSWTRQHVTGLRHRHDIAVHEDDRQQTEGWMNLTDAAVYLGVDRKTLREAMERGEIHAEHPLPVGPWVVKREELDKDAARSLAQRIERHRGHPGGHMSESVTPCLFSNSPSEAL
jgi:hypothetical protein